jgi:hypothetical protein
MNISSTRARDMVDDLEPAAITDQENDRRWLVVVR